MKTARVIFDFWGLMCALLCGAGGFYFISNNYYVIDGKMVDFSLYGWGAMIALWGVGLWRYCRNKPFFLWFAVAVSVVTGCFDGYRMLMYASRTDYFLYIRILLGVEAAVVLGLIVLKKCGSVGRGAIGLALAVLLLTNFGAVLMYPQICPLKYVYGVAGGYAVLWGIFNIVSAKKADFIAAAGSGSLLLLVCVLGGVFYFRMPGIRFYEAKITEPAKDVKVSIVVPVYNEEEAIERCLDSLRRQSLRDIEIIVVDDGSTDKTPEILAEYAAHDARIKVIRQENAYVGAARNRGLRAAKGEYVGFVDSDDMVSADYYEALYEAVKKQDQNVAITRNVQETWQGASFLQRVKGESIEFTKAIKDKLLKVKVVYSGFVWNKLYKKSFLLDNNIVFTTYRTVYEDMYFALVLYMLLDDLAVADKGTYYHTVKERRTISSSGFKLTDELFEMLRKLKDVVATIPANEQQRSKGKKFFDIYQLYNLIDSYTTLADEDKPKFYERCAAVLDAEICKKAEEFKWKKHQQTVGKLTESMGCS